MSALGTAANVSSVVGGCAIISAAVWRAGNALRGWASSITTTLLNHERRISTLEGEPWESEDDSPASPPGLATHRPRRPY